MHIYEWHSVCICIMTRCTKNIGVPNRHSNRKSAILIHFHASYFNKLLLQFEHQFTQYHTQTLYMKSYQKLSPTSNMVGVMVPSIFMLCHEASSFYNFNIQFPMYTKFITHVYDVALNTSMHQYCVISIAPPPGHKNSDKHHPIYMTFIGFFSISHTPTWHATVTWAHLPPAPPPKDCESVIKT